MDLRVNVARSSISVCCLRCLDVKEIIFISADAKFLNQQKALLCIFKLCFLTQGKEYTFQNDIMKKRNDKWMRHSFM